MFGLIRGFVHQCTARTEVHVLIIGLDNAGKTTLLEQMKGLFRSQRPGIPPDKIPPTIGLNIGKLDIGDCHVVIWDLGGQASEKRARARGARDSRVARRARARRAALAFRLSPRDAPRARRRPDDETHARRSGLARAQVRMRALWEKYFNEAHGVIFVVDACR